MADPTITLTVSTIPSISVGTAKIEESPVALDTIKLTVGSVLPTSTVATSLISKTPVYAQEYRYFDVGIFTPLWYNLTAYKVNIQYYKYSWYLTSTQMFVTKVSYYTYEYTVVDLLNIEVKRCIRSKMHNVSVYNIKVYKSISSTNKKVIS